MSEKSPVATDNIEKYGIVVLLDALGIRTTNALESKTYFNKINKLRREDIPILLLALFAADKSMDTKALPDLTYRFFGDSILITYQVADLTKLIQYFHKIAIFLNILIPTAIQSGMLFRGALSIGEFLEEEPRDESSVTLGPAVSDAATWYDRLEIVGVITTPATANSLRTMLSKVKEPFDEKLPLNKDIIWYDVPIKDGFLSTYLFNWPAFIPVTDESAERQPLFWYYDRISSFRIPLGTEKKYQNTEIFFKFSIEHGAVDFF